MLLDPFAGLPFYVSPLALKEEERLFPASKHRSRRIHKKLVKRFGGEFRKVPAIFKVTPRDDNPLAKAIGPLAAPPPVYIVIHPALYDELRAKLPVVTAGSGHG